MPGAQAKNTKEKGKKVTMSIPVAKTEEESIMRAHKKALLLAAEVAAEQLIFEIEYMQTQKQKQKQKTSEHEEQFEELAEQEDYETWMLNAHRSIYDESVCPCVSMSPIFSDTMNEYFCCKECNAKRQRLQRLLTD